jgi:hypothetical protein
MTSRINLGLVLATASLAALACKSNDSNLGDTPDGGGNGAQSEVGATGTQPGGGATTVPTGGAGGGTGVSPTCMTFGQTCANGYDCCSGVCDLHSKTCASSINQCTTTGGPCQASTECCSMACTLGVCSAGACIADDQICSDSASCCSGNCEGGLCRALNTACRTAGNPCSDAGQCCSKLCQDGVCKLGASFCIQSGDACSDSDLCCSGECVKGATGLGTCAPAPKGSTNCSDGLDGTVCGACNSCCSRLCAPYAPTGVRVCQPASGCRVNGGLCRKDSDCCGAAGTGLPGDGNVVCEIQTGKAIGICRNPRSCNPQGNVCHIKTYACTDTSSSSARNNCCEAPGNSGVCQVDNLGVPRCNGLGTTCRTAGQTCASSNDCCNQAPCVPDAAGLLHCYAVPGGSDGGVPACVPKSGACSINADCCPGSTCVQKVGSTQGVCGDATPPPGTIPSKDAGTPGSDAPAPICAEYGQICTGSADCCNAIPCWNGKCMNPIIY